MTHDPLWEDSGSAPSPYPGWMSDVDGEAYKNEVSQQFLLAMSSLAASVCVVAAINPNGERAGMTATAVCSLSTEPPQLVACMNRSSSMARAMNGTGWFSVSVLAHDQVELAGVFAGRTGLSGEDRFDDNVWTAHTTGAPVLSGAAATCICHVSASLQQATHLIVVGSVLDVINPAGESPLPLIYHGRHFTTVLPPPLSPQPND